MDDQPPTPPLAPGPEFVPPVSTEGQPWGFWATLGWSLMIVLASLTVQVAVFVLFVLFRHGSGDLSKLSQDGSVLAAATIACAPVVAGLCFLIAKLRKGIRLSDYLGLTWPRRGVVIRWLIALVAVGGLSDLVTTLLGRSWVPQVMVDLYRNTRVLWPLWIALVVGAPLGEETFFRGFLLPGLRATRLGQLGAVLVSSVAWASIHFQYDFYGMVQIFGVGILLGYARLKTGSLWLCMVMHGLLNLIATVQLELYLVVTRAP
jgi:membrane protease YdiL (CAAX protease family)